MIKPFKIKSKIYSDRRGKIFENNIYYKRINYIYSITSISKKDVLRGFHFTIGGEYKILTVLKGKIIDYCLKIKKNKLEKYKFIVCQGESLFVPKDFAHAYLCLDSENIICYHLSESYNSKNKKILKWNDPDLKINWKIKNPILSNPDKKGESLLVCRKKYF